MQDYLFVYGTLKRGHCRAFALQAEQFVGVARTAARYRLYDCGDYPALVADPDGRSIEVELYRISPEIYPTLDELEGVELGLYHRAEIALLAPYQELTSIGYLYDRPVAKFRDCGTRWP